MSVSNPNVLGDEPELKVSISYDPDAKTLTIEDTGIGMSK